MMGVVPPARVFCRYEPVGGCEAMACDDDMHMGVMGLMFFLLQFYFSIFKSSAFYLRTIIIYVFLLKRTFCQLGYVTLVLLDLFVVSC